jgi:2-phospho-L-lactate guanylyltransferase
MSLWTIVPARGLAAGKSRLAGVLDPARRLALNTLLLERVLAAIAAADGGLDRCIVVSAGADALALARDKGAVPLKDPGEPVGLNAALEAARHLARVLGATNLRVLAADLPDVNGAALVALSAAVPANGLAIVADKHGSGTNGLLLPAACKLSFAFGEDSLARHTAAARLLGFEPLIWNAPALAFDLDSPDDYREWQSRTA